MKAYIITPDELDALLTAVDRDPQHGYSGGSSVAITEEQRAAYAEAHRFYNYQIRTWISKVCK